VTRPLLRRRVLARSGALALAASLLPLVASGCDQFDSSTHVQKIIFNLAANKFSCDRQFTCDLDNTHVEYVEHVRSAGDGKSIVVELVSLNGKRRGQITDPNELAAFQNLAARLATGGGARALFQRDPHIDSIDRLSSNYFVTPVEVGREKISAAGEPSVTIKVEPKVKDRPFAVLTVSTAAQHEGFPIECQEYVYGPNGPFQTSDMRVVNLKWGDSGGDVEPPATNVASRSNLATLDAARLAAKTHGIDLYLPQDGSLPSGFDLVKAEEVAIDSTANKSGNLQRTTVYRFVYSDGLERIEFVEHAPLDAIPAPFGAATSNDLVAITSFGSISIATLVHAGTQIDVESRIAADRFHRLMKSLVKL
jgi:hypothetical protein